MIWSRFVGSYTMDVIASTAFGLDVQSQQDPNNQFVKMGKKILDFSGISFTILVLGK